MILYSETSIYFLSMKSQHHSFVGSLNFHGLRGLEELRKSSCVDFIGIKRIGELDRNPFLVKRTRLKLSNLETLEPNEEAWSESLKKAFELLNLWEDYLWNPSWKPFKIITVEGSSKVCISLLNSYQIPPLTHPSLHFFFFDKLVQAAHHFLCLFSFLNFLY